MHTNQVFRLFAFGLLISLFCLMMPTPSAAQVRVGIAVSIAPPVLPIYEQPICPGDGYIWTPGYWAWDPDVDDYYWVPGTWILAPEPGFLWTPGYWGWGDGGFFFTAGYWGPVIGFYGGVNYGFGYFGTGFVGGRWEGGHFFYNTAVSHVNVNIIHNTYITNITNVNVNRVSYNGGNGGLTARPSPAEEAAARERHVGPVAEQTRQADEARGNPDFRSKVNHGNPAVAATARAGDFKGEGVVSARGAAEARPGAPAENGPAPARAPIHARDIPAGDKPPAPNTGNAKLDQKYAQQQQQLAQKQDQERQKLQAQQDAEHAKAEKQQANAAKQQQMEQRHQQQTQKLQQRQTQETQRMVQHQAPAPHAEGGRPH